jgi:hypothetical protein
VNPKPTVRSLTVDGTSYLLGYEPAEPHSKPLTAVPYPDAIREALAAHGDPPIDPVRAVALNRMPYDEYLRTPEWRDRRRQAINAAENRCQHCRRRGRPLQVHHLTYKRRGHEHPDDLEVLCEVCHRAVHGFES